MNQKQRRIFLIKNLLNEQPRYREIEIPQDEGEQKQLLRSLLNVRKPGDISGEFLSVQDQYLLSAPMIKCKKTPRKKCRNMAERREKR